MMLRLPSSSGPQGVAEPVTAFAKNAGAPGAPPPHPVAAFAKNAGGSARVRPPRSWRTRLRAVSGPALLLFPAPLVRRQQLRQAGEQVLLLPLDAQPARALRRL